MCGITGVFAFNLVGKFSKINVAAATASLAHRGPDLHDVYVDEWVCLGFRRLAIIDTREIANQPMWDETGRWCIIYNGEIFNFKELRKGLTDRGISFATESDTEVLLKLFIREGEGCLNQLNGFFSFCIYDKAEQTFFLAIDRYGVKPLYYLYDDDKFLFGSEMKAIHAYGIKKDIDQASLYTYLQLNYIPAPDTIFTHVKKLLPGHSIKIRGGKISTKAYYTIPIDREAWDKPISYADARSRFETLLEASVQRRLVSDVPLGAFLSGGIDSSVITGLASRHKPDLQTFSIGFRDEKFFDETKYARLVAEKFKTKHTEFSLSNKDLAAHLQNILDSIDEPFADSSGIAVYILSHETRKQATVALSGDGADELLGGYNKHAAFYRALHPGLMEKAVAGLKPLWWTLPKSRHAPFSNKARQAYRFARGYPLSPSERYWYWASLSDESQARRLIRAEVPLDSYRLRKQDLLTSIPHKETMNDILHTDMRMVLPNDMLTKVDRMSMANSLEVRTPFLDFEVVNFLFTLPDAYKIDGTMRKKLLQDTFREMLPAELYGRPKKGFEVPLLKWLRRDLRSTIKNDLLSKNFIEEQGIFNYSEVRKLKSNFFGVNPSDSHARIWGLVVFQWWWKKWVGK